MLVAQDQFDNEASRARPRARRWLIVGLFAAAVLAIVVLAVLGFRPGKPAAVAAQPTPSLTVTAAVPHRASWSDQLETSGSVAAWQEAIVGAQIGGYQISDVRVNVGDQVKKGEILARFDQGLLRADEAQLEANYDQAAQNEKRALALRKDGAMAEQNVLAAVTASKTALALLQAKRLQLHYADIIAPDDGVISSRTATLGAVAPVGQELFRMIRQNRLEWRGELTAAQLVHIVAGQRIALILPDSSTAVATVRQIGPALDSQSRLGTVYADIVPGSHARAGMYANGRVALDKSDALVIPAQSVVIRDGRNYVFRLADGSNTPRVSRQEVTTGRRQGDEVEILRGVGEADRIVAQGAGFLGDNDVVRVDAAP